MKNIRTIGVLVGALCVVGLTRRPSIAQEGKSTFAQVTGKKLLEYTWGPPRPELVMEHPEALEKYPFDGTIMRPFFGSGHVFDVKHLREHKDLILGQFAKYTPIKSDKLTDNFLGMYAQSTMDWFNDDDWKDISEYTQRLSAGAKKLNCVGVMFDAEPYGFSPWIYKKQIHADTKSFDEYAAKVRQRGKEYMEAINAGFPGAKVLFLTSALGGAYNVSHNPNPQIRESVLQSTDAYQYGLYVSFYLGMLEACEGDNQLIDTIQGAYYNSSANDYYEQFWRLNIGSKVFIPQDLRSRFATYKRTASTAYVDSMMAGNQGVLSGLSATALELTPQQRLQWTEYNMYQSLRTSDEYVWLYGEQITWWKDSDKAVLNPLRDEIAAAVQRAKDKLQNGEEIGFEVKPFVDEAKQKVEARKQSLSAQLKPKTVNISKISSPIIIDGKLTEPDYQKISWLDDFVEFIQTGAKLTTSTRAWISYDDQNLYVALRCLEPDMAKQVVRSDSIWFGESADIFISKPGSLPRDPYSKYYHFMLNPENNRYNSIDQGSSSTGEKFQVNWKSATSKDNKGWYAEVAIPWVDLGIKPEKGTKLYINMARSRNAGVTEFSSWSQYDSKFQEPQNFGVLTLE